MDLAAFLGLGGGSGSPWKLTVTRTTATPGSFLFGGCGIAAGLLALEAETGRGAIWATAHFLSYAPVGAVVNYAVDTIGVGAHVTHARVAAHCEGRVVLTIAAALGSPTRGPNGVWAEMPEVATPYTCPRRPLSERLSGTVFERLDTRIARDGPHGRPGTGSAVQSALWIRVPGAARPGAAALSLIGDFVAGGITRPLGVPVTTRSLDNTIRIVDAGPADWVLCDIRVHAVANGYAHGEAFLWSEAGVLLAVASQSATVRERPDLLDADDVVESAGDPGSLP